MNISEFLSQHSTHIMSSEKTTYPSDEKDEIYLADAGSSPVNGELSCDDEDKIFAEQDVLVDITIEPERREELIARFEAIAEKEKIEISDHDIRYMVNRVNERTIEEAKNVLAEALVYHNDDPNINGETYDQIENLMKGPEFFEGSLEDYEFEIKIEAALIDDWSPYPEVRAVTQVNDDPNESCETLRVYLIGLTLAVAGVVLNTFFYNRFPSISLPTMCFQLILAPAGRAWAKVLPDWGFTIRGHRYTLNPGPWTYKEQMLCTLMISVSCSAPYAVLVLTAQRNEYFYGAKWATFGYQFLLVLTSSFMGFGIAGLMRTVLVYPVRAMWFGVLPYLALNRALIKPETKARSAGNGETKSQTTLNRFLTFWRSAESINGWTLTRNAWFWLVMTLVFGWYWIPEFLFEGLLYFNWMTWIKPQNVALAAITGGIGGLGLNPISTFDTTVIGFSGQVTPFYSSANSIIGQFISFIAIVIVWWTNVRWTSYLPINSNSIYDNTGNVYNISRVLNDHFLIDEDAYANYSPPYYSAGNLVMYGAFFMVYPGMIVYAILHYHKIIGQSFKQMWVALRNPLRSLKNYNDPFSRAISVHKEVPEWWFLVILVGSIALSIALVEHFPDTNTPVWSLFLAVGINLVFIIPFGLLYAITNTSLDVNVLVELIMGYTLPGNPNALMIVKCYATNFLSQTENYVSNQKQSHYARMPPRALFRVQFISVTITCLAAIGILNFQLTSMDDMCSPHNHERFTCAGTRSFFSASIIWGAIGPKRVFNNIYPTLKYTFLIGALIPIPFFLLEKYTKWGKYVNIIVLLNGALSWAPQNFMYTLPNFYVAFFFNWILKRKYTSWWQKYNYLMYAAISAGAAWSAFIMFFATEYKHLASVNWWGNSVPFAGLDSAGPVLQTTLPPEGYFGVPKGQFH